MTIPKEDSRIPIRRGGQGSRKDEVRENYPTAEDQAPQQAEPATSEAEEVIDWRDAAMRLKADMENYRKRQQRWAEDQIEREKTRLLTRFLEAVDNLEQALNHIQPDDPTHQGLQVAYDDILSMLIREGAERIFAQGRPFDPEIHEAVAVVPAPPDQATEMQVVDVTLPGYRYNDRVLRPARVVVAKRSV